MSNNDKFIRDTPHGKLKESIDQYSCIKCKYFHKYNCMKTTNNICVDNKSYYFAKEETDLNIEVY